MKPERRRCIRCGMNGFSVSPERLLCPFCDGAIPARVWDAPPGRRRKAAKRPLTTTEVEGILSLSRLRGDMTHRDIGDLIGRDHSVVSRVIRGQIVASA